MVSIYLMRWINRNTTETYWAVLQIVQTLVNSILLQQQQSLEASKMQQQQLQ